MHRNKYSCKRPLNVKKNTIKCRDANQSPGLFGEGYSFFGSFEYRSTISFDLLVLGSIIVQIYLYVKYAIILKDPEASFMYQFNLLNIVFCLVGRFLPELVYYFTYISSTKKNRYPNFLNISKKFEARQDKFSVIDAIFIVGFWIVIYFTQILIQFSRLNVSKQDQFLFYLFAAPSEESFFRYFMTGMLIFILAEIFIRLGIKITLLREILIKGGVGFLTGIIFGLAHSQRYSEGELLIIILNGLEFSLLYAFTRRIDVVLFIHLIINGQAGYQLFF